MPPHPSSDIDDSRVFQGLPQGHRGARGRCRNGGLATDSLLGLKVQETHLALQTVHQFLHLTVQCPHLLLPTHKDTLAADQAADLKPINVNNRQRPKPTTSRPFVNSFRSFPSFLDVFPFFRFFPGFSLFCCCLTWEMSWLDYM